MGANIIFPNILADKLMVFFKGFFRIILSLGDSSQHEENCKQNYPVNFKGLQPFIF